MRIGHVLLLPFKWLGVIIFLPFYLIYRVFHDDAKTTNLEDVKLHTLRNGIVRVLKIILILLTVLPAWVGAIVLVFFIGAYQLRYLEEPVPISGTGSMYPTFPKGEGKTPKEQSRETVGAPGMLPYPNGLRLFHKRYFGHKIARGDIAVFINSTTKKITEETYGEGTGLVKRIIGLPGDTIEIRDGILYLNNEPQKEPYIARARSTFGGTFLQDCIQVTVPAGKLFVMGDNRKGSSDSRHEVGFVDYDDITHVLPYQKQLGVYDSKWHDAANDLKETAKIHLATQEFTNLINQKRKEKGLEPLTYNAKLAQAAKLRGNAILKYNDFSFEATKSGYTMEKALQDVGYSNIVWGEAPITGYYEAEELIENIFAFPQSASFFLQEKYQDIGLAEVEGTVNGCPTQVVVQHLAGYVPPNYPKDQVESWQKLLTSLKDSQKSWQGLTTYPDFYSQNKAEIDRINELFTIRMRNIEKIVQKMVANKWLTKEETDYSYTDEKYAKELNALIKKINDKASQSN